MGGGVRENPPHPLSPPPEILLTVHRREGETYLSRHAGLAGRGRRGQEPRGAGLLRKPAQGRPRRRGLLDPQGQLPLPPGELAPAADAYRRAVDLGEVRSHANFFMGLCLIELGELRQARAPSRRSSPSPRTTRRPCSSWASSSSRRARRRGGPAPRAHGGHLPGPLREMYAEYAGALADGTEDPLLRRGLQEAVAELRRRSQEDGA